MEQTFFEKRCIALPKGGTLEVQMSPEISGRIKAHFGLPVHEAIHDDHIRMFFWSAVNTAVDKAEHEVNNERGKEAII